MVDGGMAEYKSIIHQLSDSGLTLDMIASGLNIAPDSVRKLDGRFPKRMRYFPKRYQKKRADKDTTPKKRGKIDRDRFIKLWKNSVPYDVIAKNFGVTESWARSYKSIKCKGITREIQCRCGRVFTSDSYLRGLCDSCQYESQIDFWKHNHWVGKLELGTKLLEERRRAEMEAETRKYIKREKIRMGKEEESEWWEE